MKRFLTLILFSLLIPIQNSSAAPSLEETIDFLINGDDDATWNYLSTKEDWSIDGCILTMSGRGISGDIETQRYDLNKVIVQTIKPTYDGLGFIGDCKGECRSVIGNNVSSPMKEWWVKNKITWERNVKALSHLYSNFCEGASTF